MPTITKHNIIVLGTAIVISAGIFIIAKERQKKNTTQGPPQVSYKIFNSQIGWGYEILENDKVYIHQDFVPVLPTQKGFSKKEYAEKAAQLVIEKMKTSDFPTLTKEDLAHICPLDQIVYEQPPNH